MDIQKPPSKYILARDLDPEKDRERLLSIFSYEAPPDEIYKENSSGRKPNITPRFQLFSGFLYFVNHQNDKPFNLSGHVTIYNRYDDSPDSGVSIIFEHSSDEPLPFTNTNFLFPLNDPPTQRSIPLYSSLDIVVNLTAVDEDDDNVSVRLSEDSRLPVEKYDTFCKHQIKGPEGHLDMNYIILTDPVDADLEMRFHPYCDVNDKLFHVTVWAFYGDNNDYGPFRLLDVFSPLLENGKIALNTSSIAVPATGYSLNIRATVGQIDGERDQKIFIGQSLKLTPKLKGSSSGCIHGVNCRIQVRVNWKYEADTEQNDVPEDEIYTCKHCEELKTRDKLQNGKYEADTEQNDVAAHTLKACEVLKTRDKLQKKKKKKVVNVNGKYEADTEQNDVAAHTLKECEELKTRDELQKKKKNKVVNLNGKYKADDEQNDRMIERREILLKLSKLRRKKQNMTRMDQHTDNECLRLELESLQVSLGKLKVTEGSQNRDK